MYYQDNLNCLISFGQRKHLETQKIEWLSLTAGLEQRKGIWVVSEKEQKRTGLFAFKIVPESTLRKF